MQRNDRTVKCIERMFDRYRRSMDFMMNLQMISVVPQPAEPSFLVNEITCSVTTTATTGIVRLATVKVGFRFPFKHVARIYAVD